MFAGNGSLSQKISLITCQHRDLECSHHMLMTKRSSCAPGGDGLLLWDPRTGLLVRDVEDDSTNVRYLAVSEDGQHALTATATSAIFVWNLETGACERKKEGGAADLPLYYT